MFSRPFYAPSEPPLGLPKGKIFSMGIGDKTGRIQFELPALFHVGFVHLDC